MAKVVVAKKTTKPSKAALAAEDRMEKKMGMPHNKKEEKAETMGKGMPKMAKGKGGKSC